MLIGRIDGATRVLGKPVDWNPEDKCQSLAIKDHTLDTGQNVMESSWVPTPQEAEALGKGAHIHLWVWGSGHPPVAITVEEVRTFRGRAKWQRSTGALISDSEIPGITQELSEEMAKTYGGRYFIGEMIAGEAAQSLAALLGLEWADF